MKKKLFFLMICFFAQTQASFLPKEKELSVPKEVLHYVFYKDKKPKAKHSLALYEKASDLEKENIVSDLSTIITKLAKFDLSRAKKSLRRLLRLCIYDLGVDMKKSHMKQNLSPFVVERLKKVIQLYHHILEKPLSKKVFRKTKKDFTGSGMAETINELVKKIEREL